MFFVTIIGVIIALAVILFCCFSQYREELVKKIKSRKKIENFEEKDEEENIISEYQDGESILSEIFDEVDNDEEDFLVISDEIDGDDENLAVIELSTKLEDENEDFSDLEPLTELDEENNENYREN